MLPRRGRKPKIIREIGAFRQWANGAKRCEKAREKQGFSRMPDGNAASDKMGAKKEAAGCGRPSGRLGESCEPRRTRLVTCNWAEARGRAKPVVFSTEIEEKQPVCQIDGCPQLPASATSQESVANYAAERLVIIANRDCSSCNRVATNKIETTASASKLAGDSGTCADADTAADGPFGVLKRLFHTS